ncbi:MAG: DUF362 domain-containing protein [bacterium]
MDNSIVFIEKLEQHPQDLKLQFTRSFTSFGLINIFNKARAIFIKPNLTYPTYKEGVTTRIEYIESLIAALREINSTTKIYIGEGEGGYNSFSMMTAMRVMGFFDIEKRYPNVKIVNLSKLPSRNVKLEAKGKSYFVNLPELFFDEIDFSITCPLPKIHCMTKITLAFKNQWGCLPDTMRLKNHYVFNEIIGQVSNTLKFRYAFLDGKYGLDNSGPMIGIPKKVEWFVASNSLGAFDLIVAEMMGIDWKKIYHIVEAKKRGFVPDRDQIKVIGDIDSLKVNFILKRSFWSYPALIAFYSRHLTNLVYFSRFSKIIHDIMYLFREKPIEQ